MRGACFVEFLECANVHKPTIALPANNNNITAKHIVGVVMAAALARALVGLFAVGAGEARRTSLAMQYKPLRRHANLFEDWTEWVHPPLLHAIRSSNASALLDLLREEAGGGDSSGVYSLPLFLDTEGGCAFCDLLLDELDGYYASGLPIERPNSMNNYGIIVNAIGMRPAIDRLQAAVLHPLAALVYPEQARREM